MDTIRADAESGLSALLDHVEQGVSVIVTRHGKVVARIVPEANDESYDASAAIAAIEAFRKTMPRLELEDILTARHEGHAR